MATRVLLLFLCLGAVKAQIDAVQLIDLVDPNRAVATPPMITAQPSERERPIEARRNVVLQCEGTGEPKPEFRWTKNGRFYDPSAVDDARVATQADKGTIIISRPKDSDEGLYQCIVQNPHGRAVSDKIYLRYATLGDFEKVENVPVHRVRIGDALTMKCVPPKGVPYPQIFWTIKTKTGLKQVELSDRISMDLEPGNLHFIYIKPEDMHEGGEYVCNAYNPHLNILKEGAYQGLEIINPSDPLPRQKPAMLYTTPINTVAWRGKELEMKCIFSGFPIPKFEWRRLDPNKLLPDGRYTYQSFGQSLILHDVQMEDAGEYECSARNGQGLPQKRKFTVQVLAEPYWIEKPESKHAGQGDTVTFMCLAGGKPEPIIRWYINGHPILEEQAPQTISNPNAVINYFYYTGDLTSEETGANKAQKLSDRWLINRNNFTIVDLRKEDDTMVIQCNASQQISDSYIFENAFLNVLSEAPVFRKEPYPLYEFVEGNVGEIHCDTFAAPRPTTRWYKNRRELTGGRFDMLENGNMIIDGVIFDDDGDYMCLSSNKYGTIQGTTRVIVKRKTKVVNRPQDLELQEGTTAVFRCSAVADKSLRLQIDWRKHGELINYALSQRIIKHPLDHTLLITNTQDDDTADYTCVATAYSRENDGAVLDTVRVTANLTVQSRPNRPGNVILTSCDKRSANVQWTPMGDNRAPILNYIIQFNTTFEPDIWVDLENKVSPTTRQYRVDISPWSNYTFRVIAHNKIGNSVPSDATTVCRTDPDTPDKHPENVRGNGTRPNNMVISWTPMTLLEQNGPGFRYQVKFKRHDDANAVWETVNINEARNNTYIVWGTNVYEPFDIQVKSFNVKGEAPVAVRTYVGFSGEDKPLIQVSNFQLEKVLGPRSASFRWTAVDPTARDINGEFQGYKVQAWVAEEGLENVREVRALPNASSVVLDVLKPYSDVLAQIFVFNAAYDGTPSPAITFRTPEGRSGPVATFRVTATSSNTMLLQWDLPIEPNGVVVGYRIGYQRVDGTRIGKQQFREPDLLDPFATSVQLSALEAESKYRITIWPLTGAGVGEPYYVERSTLTGGVPSTPTLSMLSRNQTHVNITWTNWDLTNRPASIYYVVFKKTGEEAWRKTPEQYTRHWIEVFPLQPGTSYTMRVVGVNDQWEAASLPLAINTLGSRKDIGDDSTIASVGSASWFIGLIIALFLLLAVFILMVLLKRRRDAQDAERQVMFPPDNMEYPAGRTGGRYTPDLQPGYTTHTYPVSRNPDPPSSRPTQEQSSVDSSDAKPPIESSDADSFHTDHGESDVVRFNEDGSFVGQYQPKKRRAPPAVPSDSAGGAAAGGGDDATQQSFDTFV